MDTFGVPGYPLWPLGGMMPSLRTMNEALECAVHVNGTGFTFIGDEGHKDSWPFARLEEASRALASALAERGLKKGDRVALILPAAADFVPCFFGVLKAGGVPVPLYPPMGLGQLGGYLEHSRHVIGAARTVFVITTRQIKAVIGALHDSVPELRAILVPSDLEGDAELYRDPGVKLSDPCFIQFTSGSTSRPKGVLVTHENLAHNCNAIMGQGLRTRPEDQAISWLPLFHDMGLIGFVLAPVQHPIRSTILSPLAFLKRPAIWLRTIHEQRGTLTYGPNFAYAITAKRVRDSELEGIDLSCLRHAGCGAEPIQVDTLRAFAKRFEAYGFRADAFVPSYGMAESTLAISFDYGIQADRVDADQLWGSGQAVPVASGDGSVEIVNCGGAFEGHRVRVVNPETSELLADRHVGEIEAWGPSVTAGYFENTEATDKAYRSDGWLKTGDLGYLVDGRVFICGRQKDVIIVNGKNYSPHDLEWAASNVPGIRAGNVIAFPSHVDGLDREAVIVVAETKEAEGRDELAASVKKEIHRITGLMVDGVRVVDAGTIPKTSSGKLQRAKCRTLYEAGDLRKKEGEGALQIAGRVAQSQFAHLKLAIFGSRNGARRSRGL